MAKSFNVQIRLRRDNDYNYKLVKDTLKPAKGEVCLVDTAKNGLLAKVGDGTSTFDQLPYTLGKFFFKGYYIESKFYSANTKSDDNLIEAIEDAIYVDVSTNRIYYYNGTFYVEITVSIPVALSTQAGIAKLYSSNGSNEDGSVTQKFFTESIEGVEFGVDESDDETLVLLKPWVQD